MYNVGGTVTISGTASFTSANDTATQGTVHNNSSGSIIINGGTVSNTASGNAVYNSGAGSITLGGAPEITGVIGQGAASLGLRLNNFAPASKVYTLDFADYSGGLTAVRGIENFSANFALKNTSWSLEKINDDLVIMNSSVTLVPAGTQYIITGSGTQFTAKRNSVTVGAADQPIQNVLNAIRSEAVGVDIGIQFGDGSSVLNIGTAYAQFSGVWGFITLTGKITSGTSGTVFNGTVTIADSVSLASTADIENTQNGTAGYAVCNAGSGTVTITSGTVSRATGATGSAVFNNSSGSVVISGTANVTSVGTTTSYGAVGNNSSGSITINGGTVSNTASGNAVHNSGSGTVTITSGTFSATTGSAMYNSLGSTIISDGNFSATTGSAMYNSSGSTIISDGNFSATTGYAMRNASTATITGGTFSAITGSAIYNTGTVTISGTASFTSANDAATEGTINNASNSASGCRTIINGGTVSNTASGNAVYIGGNSPGTITLGGNPTITGVILRSSTTMIVSVSGDTVFAPTSGKVYTLGYATTTPGTNTVAVTGGAAFLENFELASTITTRKLAVGTGANANNLMIVANP